MGLKNALKRQGDFCFRWRSYLPLLVLPLFFVCLMSFGQNLISKGALNSASSWDFELLSLCDKPLDFNAPLVIIALVVGILGQIIRVLVAGYAPRDTSGRNTRAQKAATLNTTGIYSLCRNPLYLGNFLMMLAPVLLLGNWLFALCFCLAFWLYYERIIYAEESFLSEKFGAKYLAWARQTPAFFPRLRAFTPNARSFSLKATLKREYHSLFGLAGSLFGVHCLIILYEAFFDMRLRAIAFEPIITGFFALCAVIYLATRILAKKSKILEVQGR